MAEGGQGSEFQSLRGGSDVDIDLICSPCGEDNIREEAVKYCPECHEYLCVSCSNYHGRLKLTRTHRLLDADKASQAPVAATKCLYHQDRDIEMYCGTHDMVYCTMCIATEHRSCSGVSRIEVVQQTISIQDTEIQQLLGDAKHAVERMKAMTLNKRENITSLEEQRDTIREKIQDIERQLIEHAKKLKNDLLDSLDKGYLNMKTELENEISTANSMMNGFERTSKQLQSISGAGQRQQFIQMKLAHKAVTDANTLDENEATETRALEFNENTELINSLKTVHALGNIGVRNKHIAYKMKSKKEINVQISSDKNTCSISDVCQLADGTVLLADQNNRKVKRMNTHLTVKDQCDLDAIPTGICSIDRNEIAVKMDNDKIQFITVGALMSKTRCISIIGGGYYGMTCCAEELWVSTGCGVNVYSTTGELIQSIDKGPNGEKLFKSIFQHMAVSADTVIVTDYSDGAVCLNRNGTVRRELRDGRLKITRGVCVSDDGTVFLAGYNSYIIVMFSSDGKCLGELISSDAGLKNPTSLCYDMNNRGIIVGCNDNTTYRRNLVTADKDPILIRLIDFWGGFSGYHRKLSIILVYLRICWSVVCFQP